MTYDVAIIGGGLAGLNAALKCKQAGRSVILLEASDAVGGKLRTDRDDEGFLYDRGFQVYFTAYDEFPAGLLSKVELCDFDPGAHIVGQGIINRKKPVDTLFSRAATTLDLLRLLRLNQVSRGWESFAKHQTTREFLTEFGFSDRAMNKFFSPFLGGIFLDRKLSVSAKQFLKTWHYLSSGRTVIPRNGIAQLPAFLAAEAGLDAELRLSCPAGAVVPTDGGFEIQTPEGNYRSRVVINAAGPRGNSNQIGDLHYKTSICLYFGSTQAVTRGKSIILNPSPNAFVNQLVPLSNVNPHCAPRGMHLCSATIIGDRPESDEELARMAIEEMSGCGLNLPELEFKRAYRIVEAQLLQEPGFEDLVPAINTDLPGVFLAGEMTTSSSINDALKSGRLAAEAALAYLGGQ